MKLTKKVSVSIIASICITGAAIYFSQHTLFSKKAAAEVPSFKVEKGTITVSINGTGAVVSTEKDDITAKKNGIVKKIYKVEDDTVKQGELIMELKDDDVNIQIEDVTMNIKNYERDLANRIKERDAQMVKAQNDGIITELSVEEGDVIKSSTVIANITNYSKYKLSVPFLFSQLKAISLGQKVMVFLPEYITHVEGIVSNIANFSRPGPGGKLYGYVDIDVDNPGSIKIDAKASATIKIEGQEVASQEYGKLEVYKKSQVKYETTRPVTVKTIHVKENEFVKKGQLLLELNDENFDIDIDNLNSRLRKAQLQLQSLLYQRDNMKIFATMNGTISKQKINIEDGVNLGQIVSSISNYNKMEFSIPVDELDISKIKQAMSVDVTVDALPGRQFKGKVSKIANEGVAQNGVATYLVTVSILDPKGLKVGMTANAQIILSQKTDVLMLRMAAVQQYNKKYFVIPKMVDGKIQDFNNPNKKNVQIEAGINNKDYIEIVNGLKEGDEVLSSRPSAKNASAPAASNPLSGIVK